MPALAQTYTYRVVTRTRKTGVSGIVHLLSVTAIPETSLADLFKITNQFSEIQCSYQDVQSMIPNIGTSKFVLVILQRFTSFKNYTIFLRESVLNKNFIAKFVIYCTFCACKGS